MSACITGAVGAMTMAGESRFIAPRKARATVTLMLNHLYDLQPTLRSPDYYTAALELMRRVHKRALIVVLSNLRDEDDDTLLPALNLMRRATWCYSRACASVSSRKRSRRG